MSLAAVAPRRPAHAPAGRGRRAPGWTGGFPGRRLAPAAAAALLLLMAAPAVPQAPAPAAGSFLVAARHLRDANFSRTVVLLIEYGADGAMGLVVNRPTEMPLTVLFPDLEPLRERADTAFIGGPVARTTMTMLVRSAVADEDSRPVTEGIHVSSSRALLERLASTASEGPLFRVFSGYAGWAAGQLDGEMRRGDWFVLPGDPTIVFDRPPLDVWPELIRRSASSWAGLRSIPAR